MQALMDAVNKIPRGGEFLIVGALLAFGTSKTTVQWVALGAGGALFLLSMMNENKAP